ncbi:uncharacterized protein LOC115613037 [Strigops habroptila]|uniref:uncharacterized protein LOC115613037 n=1 Tax=Strigops habroptila TaxID=2489341 RepID=UPI0011CF3667|nr:uncharacterized protein LOC115613037 [Strigops habroptila]
MRAAARGQRLDWQGGRRYLGRRPMAGKGRGRGAGRRLRGGALALRLGPCHGGWGGVGAARPAAGSVSVSPRRLRALTRAKRRGAALLPPVCPVSLQERPSGEQAVGVQPVPDRPDPAVTPGEDHTAQAHILTHAVTAATMRSGIRNQSQLIIQHPKAQTSEGCHIAPTHLSVTRKLLTPSLCHWGEEPTALHWFHNSTGCPAPPLEANRLCCSSW